MTVKKSTPRTTGTTQAKPGAPVRKVAARKPAAAKVAAAAKPAAQAVVKPAKHEKKTKKDKKDAGKIKVVRDSFTMPQDDYAKLGELKQLCLKAGLQVKKSELLRVGLQALSKLSAAQLTQAVASLEKIKTGRPTGSQAGK
jgi:hypothetical protein